MPKYVWYYIRVKDAHHTGTEEILCAAVTKGR